jgi:FkbH-like protein
VPPTATANPIVRNPFFERLTLSDEDRVRTVRDEEQKARASAEFEANSVEDYLLSLKLKVSTTPMVAGDVARTAQLTQKTNQLNLTTRRYTEADIEAMLHSDGSRVYVTRAEDRFGDHGLIGIMIAHTRDDDWQLDSLLLSCRVIGRGVETAMLSFLLADAQALGCTSLFAQFIETAKNAPAAQLLAQHGFRELNINGGTHDYVYDLDAGIVAMPSWIEEQTIEGS